MKTIPKFIALGLCTAAIALTGCRGKQDISSSYSLFKFDTTCVSNNGDGTQTLRAWGTGPSAMNLGASRGAKK